MNLLYNCIIGKYFTDKSQNVPIKNVAGLKILFLSSSYDKHTYLGPASADYFQGVVWADR